MFFGLGIRPYLHSSYLYFRGIGFDCWPECWFLCWGFPSDFSTKMRGVSLMIGRDSYPASYFEFVSNHLLIRLCVAGIPFGSCASWNVFPLVRIVRYYLSYPASGFSFTSEISRKPVRPVCRRMRSIMSLLYLILFLCIGVSFIICCRRSIYLAQRDSTPNSLT